MGARQIDDHHVLSPFLGVSKQFLLQCLVLLGGLAAAARAGDGSNFHFPIFAANVDFRRSADQRKAVMFLLELDGFSLVGASPEIHVRCENRKVEIRPIAGTRRRGKSSQEDEALEKELLADPKERAEHVMIVNLPRTHRGRVCGFGPAEYKDLMTSEPYSHAMHMLSQDEETGAVHKPPYDMGRPPFPAGTLSGA